ncbi:MAG: hypothetical protein FWH11_03645 [Micrococcales bacterium]|nr:hypothetical protein [Micrococcales bacterium]
MTAPTLAAPRETVSTTWRRALRLVSLNLSGRTFLAGYATLGIVTAMMAASYVTPLFEDASDNVIVSLGSALWAWPLLAAVLVPARNYARTLHLGARPGDFYRGALLTVGVFSLGVGVATTGLHYTLDAVTLHHVEDIAGISEAMGHFDHLPALAWLATATAVLVMALIAQTVVLVQTRWAARPGLLVTVDAVLVAALVVTLSVAPLRHGLHTVLWWTMSGPNPLVQVPLGLAAAAGLALLGWVLLRRRTY